MNNTTLPVMQINTDVALPDNDKWENRFEVRSETSDRVYTIAQNKDNRYWGCSCPGWKRYRRCKHLIAINLPLNEEPYEVAIENY